MEPPELGLEFCVCTLIIGLKMTVDPDTIRSVPCPECGCRVWHITEHDKAYCDDGSHTATKEALDEAEAGYTPLRDTQWFAGQTAGREDAGDGLAELNTDS